MSPKSKTKTTQLRPWHSAGPRANPWEKLRQTMTPRPTAATFLQLCDRALDTALRIHPDWDEEMLFGYVRWIVEKGGLKLVASK